MPAIPINASASLARTLLAAAALGAPALRAAPPAKPEAAAVGAPTREPSPLSWLYKLFAPMAAGNRVRRAGYDSELSNSFSLTAVRPVRQEEENAPSARPAWALPAPVADAPRAAPIRETAAAWDFSVPIVAPTAARVAHLEPLPSAAASTGSALPSGLAASAAPTRTSPGGPVFSLGSTPASFGADATAAAPLASGPVVAGAPFTRRSTAVVGPQPQTAEQSGFVNTTDPNLGYTYLGATYTVLSPTDAFADLADGYDQAGTVTHSSGTLTIGNFFDLGDQPGSNGTYNLSGTGTINTPVTYVGYQGTGVFNQSGGTHNVGSMGLQIGYFPTSNGTYTLSGGTLSVTGPTSLGYLGTGVFTQSGGTATLGQLLFVGQGGTGTFNLNSGSLYVTSIALGSSGGGTSTFNFNGGILRSTSSNGTTFFPNVLTTANVRNGGAIFFTNGFNVTVGQPLVHSTVGGDNATDGGLSKDGTGTLTLTGANTYTGTTYVDTGTLLVNGTSSGTGRVTVENNGSVLGGTGTISAPVTVTASGAINPGPNAGTNGTAANVGTLTTGALTLASTAKPIFDLADMTTYDKLVVNGSSTLGGTLTLYANAGSTFTTGTVLDLIHLNSGVLTGAFSNAPTGSTYTTSGETFTVLQTATDFELVAQTAVPEPATWLGGALLAAGAGWSLRRRVRVA